MSSTGTHGHKRILQGMSLIILPALCAIVFAESTPRGRLLGVPAGTLGTVGAVYPIAEPDAVSEIEERARQVDWERLIGGKIVEKKVSAYRPAGLKSLPRTEKGRKYDIDLTYTLTGDIPDGEGGVLYPRGYRFNPLDYLTFPNTIVVLDGADPEQVGWFKSSQYFDNFKTILLITGGSYSDLSRELRRPVYYADGAIIDRFRLKATPAVVKQQGKKMEAQEIAVKRPS